MDAFAPRADRVTIHLVPPGQVTYPVVVAFLIQNHEEVAYGYPPCCRGVRIVVCGFSPVFFALFPSRCHRDTWPFYLGDENACSVKTHEPPPLK